jgi:hypothetical protein
VILDIKRKILGLPLKEAVRKVTRRRCLRAGGSKEEKEALLRGTANGLLQTPAYYPNPRKENKQWTTSR